jgi:hypothetical protein
LSTGPRFFELDACRSNATDGGYVNSFALEKVRNALILYKGINGSEMTQLLGPMQFQLLGGALIATAITFIVVVLVLGFLLGAALFLPFLL